MKSKIELTQALVKEKGIDAIVNPEWQTVQVPTSFPKIYDLSLWYQKEWGLSVAAANILGRHKVFPIEALALTIEEFLSYLTAGPQTCVHFVQQRKAWADIHLAKQNILDVVSTLPAGTVLRLVYKYRNLKGIPKLLSLLLAGIISMDEVQRAKLLKRDKSASWRNTGHRVERVVTTEAFDPVRFVDLTYETLETLEVIST